MKKFLIATLAVVSLISCKKDIVKVPDDYGVVEVEKPKGEYMFDKTFKRVAYSWSNVDPVLFDTAKLDYITHIHFAFLYPKIDGSLTDLVDKGRFEALKNLAKEKGVKAAVSLAGDENVYRTIASNEHVRRVFVKNVVDFAVRNDLSGIDLDWEYPRANYGSDITFTLLVRELATELHSWHKYLSIAVTAGLYNGPVKDGITSEAIAAVDFVNLMAYDAMGRDPESPNHHSTTAIAQQVLDVWTNEKGVPKEKVVLGLPLYGKDIDNNSLSYLNLLLEGADPNKNMFTIENVTYYYNGILSVKEKTLLAKDRGNGIMFWEYTQDADNDNSLIKAAFEASN